MSTTNRRPWLILLICCMSLLIVGTDATIVNVALPGIGQGLHASLSGLQWSVDAYTLVIASLLMASGSMADRFGRRRVFQTGLALFTLGSLLCSVATSVTALVIFRCLQALGGSMLNPVALSIVSRSSPPWAASSARRAGRCNRARPVRPRRKRRHGPGGGPAEGGKVVR
jgi:MFS family permease